MRVALVASLLVCCAVGQLETVKETAQRLRSFNRAAQLAALNSEAFSDALHIVATRDATLVTPRHNAVIHEFPSAITQVWPLLGVKLWLPQFDQRVAYLDNQHVAVLADIFTQRKEADCAQAEAVAARLTLDKDSGLASKIEFTSIYGSHEHKEAAKCGGAPEPETTAAASKATEERQQATFDKLNSLRSMSRWVNETFADVSALHFPNRSAALGRAAAAGALNFLESAVWASVREHYMINNNLVLSDITLFWKWSGSVQPLVHRALVVMQYKDGKIKDMEVYLYDVVSVLKTLHDNKAAAQAAKQQADDALKQIHTGEL